MQAWLHPYTLDQKMHSVLFPTLTIIINNYLNNWLVPRFIKTRPLITKPKFGKNELKNYRPVLNIAHSSNLFENAVIERLEKHMSDNNLHEKWNLHIAQTMLPKQL